MDRTLALVAGFGVLLGWVACDDRTGDDGGATGSTTSATGTTTTTSTTVPPTYGCNPVTNEGCDTAGNEACDVNFTAKVFQCYGPPNQGEPCAPCGEDEGWCQPSFGCLDGRCAKLCCEDADCGPEAACDHTIYSQIGNGEVGACVGGAGGGGAGGGAAGAAGGTACDGIPSEPPSKGACVPGYGGSGGAGGSAGSGGAGGSAGSGGAAGGARPA
jgi:hypothetical protein